MEVDYIIVGCGLAGINFCHQLMEHDKSFVVFDNSTQQSSVVAGGLYNPVVLKRFTPVWKSDEQLQLVDTVYSKIESFIETQVDFKLPVMRLFNSIEEQNNWFVASDKYGLQKYLSPNVIPNANNAIKAHAGFGEVLHTGRIDTETLLQRFKQKLKELNLLIQEAFDYDSIGFSNDKINYKNLQAKHVVFCEGFGLKQNPFFKGLPLNGTKGELLTIRAPKLNIDFVLKSSAFLIPLGDDLYKLGATYNWTDKTNTPSEEGKKELLDKLKSFINCNVEVVDHVAGIRPTVIDRRPLVGRHSKHKNLYILNGLGTRGVMIAPYAAIQLYNHIETAANLDAEIDIKRFSS